MNFYLKNILSATALVLAIVSCKEKAKEAETTEVEQVAEVKAESIAYTVDTAASTIEWKGYKPTGSHNGSLKLASGTLNTTDGKIGSGTFSIDMNSITVLDIPEDNEGNAKLTGHLKAEDFFNVAAHPNASFKITGLETVDGKTMLSGNLTIKDIKNNVTFPVTVSENAGTIFLKSDTFTIDRTKWNIKYGSKSFFDNLGDKFINDDIELKVNVNAKKS
jgi:polyisoprenoid-binding protein YceI